MVPVIEVCKINREKKLNRSGFEPLIYLVQHIKN